MSMPKQDLSSRHFQRKISEFCELHIAPIASKRVLENVRPYLIRLIIYRKPPPILNGRIDWTTIGQACGIEDELTAELKRQLRPGLDAIIRWLGAPPAFEDARPTRPAARTSTTAQVKPQATASSTRKPQRLAADGAFAQSACVARTAAETDQSVSGAIVRRDRGSGEFSRCARLSSATAIGSFTAQPSA